MPFFATNEDPTKRSRSVDAAANGDVDVPRSDTTHDRKGSVSDRYT